MNGIEELPIYISHPRIFDGEAIKLHTEEFQREFGKDNIYIPVFNTDYRSGPQTIGADMLETEIKINIDASFPRDVEDTLPFAGEAGSVLSISGDTVTITDHPISFAATDTWHPIGAVDLIPGTFTMETAAGEVALDQGTDYEVDYPRGRVRILSSGSATAGTDFQYTADFRYSKRNMGRICQRLSAMGGSVVVAVDDAVADENDDSQIESASEARSTYTVFPNDVNYSWQAGQPEESKLEFSGREAVESQQ